MIPDPFERQPSLRSQLLGLVCLFCVLAAPVNFADRHYLRACVLLAFGAGGLWVLWVHWTAEARRRDRRNQ